MRFAIPVQGGRLNRHFGHSATFALIDADPATRELLAAGEVEAPPHEPGRLPPWLKEQGVSHVIAAGMGERAQALCEHLEIQVVTGAPEEEAHTLVASYLAGTLVTRPHVCDH